MLLGLLSGVFAVQSALTMASGLCDGVWKDLLQDPAVKQAIEQAWKDTQEGTPDEHEVGGVVYKCKDPQGGTVTVVETFSGGPDSGELKQNPENGCKLVGFFHTHPGLGEDSKYKYEEPSDTDIGTSANWGVPGLIIAGEGPDPDNTKNIVFHGGGAYEECQDQPPPTSPPPPPGGDNGILGRLFGDPHFQTLDGYLYDFQGAGEFVLARAAGGSGDDFEVQVRQEPPSENARQVTVPTAVVARVDGAVVEVSETDLIVDGERRGRPPSETITTPGGGEVVVSPAEVVYRWADGSTMIVGEWSVVLAAAETRAGGLEGLLGDFDGDQANDLVAGGDNLLADGSASFDELYGPFRDAWRVTDETSLFTYPDGQSASDYVDESIPTFPLIAGYVPAEQRAAAEQTCVAAGVAEPRLLLDCIVDVGVTGDSTFAQAAARLDNLEGRAGRGDEEPPIVIAARDGRRPEIERLLAEGADPDTPGSDGLTPLMWAATGGHLDVVRTLLGAGASATVAADDGSTALHEAAAWGHAEAAQLLIDAGADLEARDSDGATPLALAAERGDGATVRVLAGAGADLAAETEDGRTPLHWAVVGGSNGAVGELIAAGADVDAAGPDGQTPLHVAALWGFEEIATALLDAGADRDAENDFGETPADVAEAQGRDDLAEVLR